MKNKYAPLILILLTLANKLSANKPQFEYSQPPKKIDEKKLIKTEEKINAPIIFKATNIDAIELKNHIQENFPNLKIFANSKTQKITLLGPHKTVNQAIDLLNQIDTPQKQLLYEVEIIEISHANLEQYTNALSKLSSGININLDLAKKAIILPSNLDATLAGLIQKGEAKIIAKPILKTTESNRAYVRVGDQLPFLTSISEGQIKISNFQQINTGIYVEILPRITSTSNVLTSLLIEISTVKIWKEMNNIQYPILATRKTETTVSISENNPLIIAGLLQEDENKNENKIPFLEKIPIIGSLFKGSKQEKTQTDVLIKIKLQIEK